MTMVENGTWFRDVDNATLMFDWCSWEWEVEGQYGVWDSDFRFDVYCMQITALG